MLSRIFIRRLSCPPNNQPLGIVPKNARYKKVQDMQTAFCRDDGLLVWQKNGGKDKLGYYATLTLMVCGFVPSLGTILCMCLPSKPAVEE